MRTLVAAILFFSVLSAVASEVGTQNPQRVETAKKVAVTIALTEKGAGQSWSEEPLTFKATAHQEAELNARVETMNAKISTDLDALITSKLEKSLEK